MKVGFISLGCAKNQVDTEVMMAALKSAGHRIVNSVEQAEAVVVNTCGFIEPAREEAIDTLLETSQQRDKGRLKYLIATGCLSQLHGEELLREMPELDAVVGVSSFRDIADVLERVSQGERVSRLGPLPVQYPEEAPRLLSTPAGYAYLRVTEGCNNRCAYCTIPTIRGNLRSRPVEDIEREARQLVARGIKELVLVAQDTSAYGTDLYGAPRLAPLLEQLGRVEELEWIRLMYLHPAHITPELIEMISRPGIVIPYLDIPIQHSSAAVLQKMKRGYGSQELSSLIAQLRKAIPGLVLRTTVMVGFPGETRADHDELAAFVHETEFDWLGCFTFIPEPGTAAAAMSGQVPEEVKEERRNAIMRMQQRITRHKNISRLDQQEKVLISSRVNKDIYLGRTYFQAPEVDGVTLVKSSHHLEPGRFYPVDLKAVKHYDMIGEVHEFAQ